MPRRPRTTEPKTKLSARRQAAGLTQRQLSERSGLPLRTVQRLEQGQSANPPLRYLVNLAIALDCQLGELLEDEWLEWMVFDARAQDPRADSA